MKLVVHTLIITAVFTATWIMSVRYIIPDTDQTVWHNKVMKTVVHPYDSVARETAGDSKLDAEIENSTFRQKSRPDVVSVANLSADEKPTSAPPATQNVSSYEGCICGGDKSPWVEASDMLRRIPWLTCADPRAMFEEDRKDDNAADDEVDVGRGMNETTQNEVNSSSLELPSAPSFRKHQKVVSFSVFSSTSSFSGQGRWSRGDWPPNRWLDRIVRNSKAFKTIYPGWFMRVYHRFTESSGECNQLCAERDVNPKLSLCFVQDIPGFPEVTKAMGTLWRFLPMVDAGVDVFASRDADGSLSPREASAVEDWLKSGETLHVMHDHPDHGASMLAGMWGTSVLRNNTPSDERRAMLRKLAAKVFQSSRREPFKALDQELLAHHVAKVFADTGDYVDHSSYLCNQMGFRSRPFPTKRNMTEATLNDGTYFVGGGPVVNETNSTSAVNSSAVEATTANVTTASASASVTKQPLFRSPCPETCRPSYGKDWEYC